MFNACHAIGLVQSSLLKSKKKKLILVFFNGLYDKDFFYALIRPGKFRKE